MAEDARFLSPLAGILVLLALGGCKGNINDGTDVIAVTDRVSLDSQGNEGTGPSDFPSVSADGRYVVFSSDAINLVPGDTNGATDVFRRDRLLGVTELVSVGLLGAPANGASSRPSISANGQFVAFQSLASNLVAGDVDGTSDVFVRDMVGGTTTIASVTSAGAESTTQFVGSTGAVISADGQYVVFMSDATDLAATPIDPGSFTNVFGHHNVSLGVTELVNINALGTASGNLDGTFPSISADGSVVAFVSAATNLVSPNSNGNQHVFARNMNSGKNEVISVDSKGMEGNAMSEGPSISGDGTRVVFDSLASNLVNTPSVPSFTQVFLRDRTQLSTTLVSVNVSGAMGAASSIKATISGNGLYVAFVSAAADLVSDDTNNLPDIFWRDLANAVTLRVSVRTYGGESHPTGPFKGSPALTQDGRFVAFDSTAPDLVSNDTNGVDDVFIRGPLY